MNDRVWRRRAWAENLQETIPLGSSGVTRRLWRKCLDGRRATLREWAKKGRIERRYGDDNKVYYRIETPRNKDGNGGNKGEVNAEMHPEIYRQVDGERNVLREQRAELILQLSRKTADR